MPAKTASAQVSVVRPSVGASVSIVVMRRRWRHALPDRCRPAVVAPVPASGGAHTRAMAEPTGQTVRFSRSGDRTVAWAAVGTGPPLVVGGWWMSHLELTWADPAFRGVLTALAERHPVGPYDPPGAGLSPGAPDRTLDGEVAALAQVLAALD